MRRGRRRRVTPLLAAIAVASCLGLPHPAVAAPEPPPLTVMVADTDTMGRILTDLDGRTLYRFDREGDGNIACFRSCTDTHKPLLNPPGAELRLPPGIAGTLGTVARPDGGDQVTYDGSPLYSYTGDLQPADTNGVDLFWHVINPENAPVPAETTG
ncbi:COG4315 family predicted lipoprotein [Streptomyces lutosisoli]|uniref:Lipoprotein n=1 Tax=Streptomyces lutosisoli TaxID=2665721 RepID=A0ABW2VXP1_9ACTN